MKKIVLLLGLITMLLTSCDFQPEWKLDRNRFPVVKSFVIPQTGDSIHIFKDNSLYKYGRFGAAVNDSIVIEALYTDFKQSGSLLIASHPGSKNVSGWKDIFDMHGKTVKRFCNKIVSFKDSNYLLAFENNKLNCVFCVLDQGNKATYIYAQSREETRVLSIKKGVIIYADGAELRAADLNGNSLLVLGFSQKNGDRLEMADTDKPVLVGKHHFNFGDAFEIYYLKGSKWEQISDIRKINKVTKNQITYIDYSGKKRMLDL